MAITTVSSHVVSVNAIQGTLIADNAITAVHIATNAVSGTLIADNAVTATHIAQNTITVTQIADDAIEAAKIADGVITTNHLNKAMISSQTEVTPVAGDFVLIGDTSDSNNLKKTPISGITALATISGISSSADATAITIDSSERVGIGTGSPTQTLDVRGGSGAGTHTHAVFTGTASRGLALKSGQTGGQHNGKAILDAQDTESGGASMDFQIGGTTKVTIDNSGNLAVGNTSPSYKFEVSGTGGTRMMVENTDTNWAAVDIRAGGNQSNYIFFKDDSAERARIQVLDGNDIAISTGDSPSEKFRIANDGKVGIGTNSPDDLLDIMGGGYDQIRIGSNKTDNTNKTAGIVSTMYTNNSVSFMQGFFQNGNNAVYYGSADGAHRGLQNHYFYVNSDYNATSGHTLAMNINSSGQMTRPTHPAFHAYGATSATSDADVIYANVYVNTGSHYSTTNGRFTAPVAGVYLFFWSAIGNSNNDVYRYWIMKNGSKTIANSGNDIHLRLDTLATGSEYEFGTRVQMLSLAANDYVQINFKADSGNSTYVGSQDDYMNFGGYLIG